MPINKDQLKEKWRKAWNDPVWSKVIAWGICGIIGAVLIGIVALFNSLYNHIPFAKAFKSTTLFLSNSWSIPVWIILLLALVYLFFTWSAFKKFLIELRKKRQTLKEEEVEELPMATMDSTAFFSYRVAQAFPGTRGLVWFDKSTEATKRLLLLLKDPLRFLGTEWGGDSQPVWWFRAGSALPILKSKRLGKNRILLDSQELKIKRIAVYHGQQYFRDFIYVECEPESSTGLYKYKDGQISSVVEYRGYYSEQYALTDDILFWKKRIRSEDFDDGATTIRGKVKPTKNTELRERFLTNYNFIITAKGSPYNSNLFDSGSGAYLDGILKGVVTPEELFEFMNSLKKK